MTDRAQAFGGIETALMGVFAGVCMLQSLKAVVSGSEDDRVWTKAKPLLAKAFGAFLALRWAVSKCVRADVHA